MSFKKGAFQISAQKISCQILLNRIAKLFLEIRVRCEQCKPLQSQVINTRDSRVYDAEQHGDHNITSFSRSLICEMTFFRLYQLYSKYKTLLFCPLSLGTKNMCYYLVISGLGDGLEIMRTVVKLSKWDHVMSKLYQNQMKVNDALHIPL